MQQISSFRTKHLRWMYLLICQRNPNGLKKLLNVGDDGAKHSGTSWAASFLQDDGGGQSVSAVASVGSCTVRLTGKLYSPGELVLCVSACLLYHGSTCESRSCGLSTATGTVQGLVEGR